jgi:hypothetical protein
MMVVISGDKDDFCVDELLAIAWEHKFNEALKSHQRNVILREREFEEIPVENECGLGKTFVVPNEFPKAVGEPFQDFTSLMWIHFADFGPQMRQETIVCS